MAVGDAQRGYGSVYRPSNTAPVARQHRRVLPPHLKAPCAPVRSEVVQPPLQMLRQQLHRLVLVALHHDHVRQMYLRVHPEVDSVHAQVKRRPQPRLSLLQCVSARRRDLAAAGGVRSILVVLGSRSRPPTRIAAYACSIAQAANTVSQAVGVGVDVSEAPYIDGPLSRSGTFCIISHLCAWSSVWRCRLPQVCL